MSNKNSNQLSDLHINQLHRLKWKNINIKYYFIQMKEMNNRDDRTSKSVFLQKFAGKLNILTKHGQIRDQKDWKLPVICTTPSRRSNTMLLRSSNKSAFSFSSESVRTSNSKTAVINQRAEKYLTHNRNGKLVQLSNTFLKDPHHKELKLSRIKHKTTEPLSYLPLSKQFVSARRQNQQDNPFAHLQNNGCHDYSSFLNQLDRVSRLVKHKQQVS